MNYDFMTLDVFTDRMFGGNPLAVLPDAKGLKTEQMQAIARETNFAETTFVTAQSGNSPTIAMRTMPMAMSTSIREKPPRRETCLLYTADLLRFSMGRFLSLPLVPFPGFVVLVAEVPLHIGVVELLDPHAPRGCRLDADLEKVLVGVGKPNGSPCVG